MHVEHESSLSEELKKLFNSLFRSSVLADISDDDLKFKLVHNYGKQTVHFDLNSIAYVKVVNARNGPSGDENDDDMLISKL